MKKADYNRIMSLYKNTEVDAKTCVQIIIQLSTEPLQATELIFDFLGETGHLSGAPI